MLPTAVGQLVADRTHVLETMAVAEGRGVRVARAPAPRTRADPHRDRLGRAPARFRDTACLPDRPALRQSGEVRAGDGHPRLTKRYDHLPEPGPHLLVIVRPADAGKRRGEGTQPHLGHRGGRLQDDVTVLLCEWLGPRPDAAGPAAARAGLHTA
ncbi:hypothetical protein ACGRHY_01020 [Streptomyces sp. HK10]|uniref:hypothetical protein n=1 Tax=Streptomyces sp. HK10 TaxID=3373255 RepID=UPI0037486003